MIEVTDEMLALLREYQMGAYGEMDDFCDKHIIVALIELHEQSKPKPDPVAYKICNPAGCVLVESKRQAEKLASEYGDGTYQPLYTTPPTREPLSEVEILKLALRDCYPIQFVDRSYGITLDKVTVVDFARLIEQAHGIGVTND